MQTIIKCKECGKEIIIKTGRGKRKYCSIKCRQKYWIKNNKKRIKFICECCGKEFGRPRRENIKGKKVRYCSRDCANKSSRTPLIKQKTRNKTRGYISIWKPEHPNNYNGRVREHILVMEKMIGRHLKEGEIVHHINYIEDDNREENLYLCETFKGHNRIHRKTRYLIKEFIRSKGLKEELTDYIRKEYLIKEEKRKG